MISIILKYGWKIGGNIFGGAKQLSKCSPDGKAEICKRLENLKIAEFEIFYKIFPLKKLSKHVLIYSFDISKQYIAFLRRLSMSPF